MKILRNLLILIFLFFLVVFILRQSGGIREWEAGDITIPNEQEEVLEKNEELSENNEEISISSGTFEYNLQVNGVQRKGVIHIPEGYNARGSAVIVLHGGELGSAEKVQDQTGFDSYANTNNFLVIYPNSLRDQWNDGRPETNTDAQDLEFIGALIQDLIENYGVDPKKVFVTGVSNGGLMAQWLVCNNIYDFAAIAPVVANFPTQAVSSCNPKAPLPIVFFHGTGDPSYLGSEGRTEDSILSKGAGGEVLSADETIELWKDFNKCSKKGPITYIDEYPRDKVSVEKYEYTDCAEGSALLRYKVIGGGHAWFGMDLGPIAKRLVGEPGKEIIAVEEIVNFFQRYGL